jgi:transposase InsO family protein
MDANIKKRLEWVTLYEVLGDAGTTCRRCGISRPTLRKWARRYAALGMKGLEEHSRRPTSVEPHKLTEPTKRLVLVMRRTRNLGHRRIQSELKRLHEISLSLASIDKIFKQAQEKALLRRRPGRKHNLRYNKEIPGERVQMDVCKIAPGRYQYTAVDDCTRCRVLALYSRQNAKNTVDFIDRIVEEFPFPIQRVQTDRGSEFFAAKVQQYLKVFGIKFRPNKPRAPYLNGKVERSQKTDLQEFYSTVDLDTPDLENLLSEWQHYYNWYRPHSSLGGKTPMERYFELSNQTPFLDEVIANYDPDKEHEQERNYQTELVLRKLKRSL